MRTTLLIFFVVYSFAGFAQTPSPGGLLCDDQVNPIVKTVLSAQTAGCPNWNKIKDICVDISNKSSDPNPIARNLRFTYQRKVYEAACVDVQKDDQATINRKVSAMWANFENKLTCNNLQFDVNNGSVIKFAAVSNFDPFIYDMIKWKVNLNKVDAGDNRTLLDYVDFHRKKNKGNALESTLNDYYNELKDAGAKHLQEL